MDSVEELGALLDRHGEALFAIPGVTGAAIGAATDGGVAIHVYVSAEIPVAAGAEARRLLAPAPVEVIPASLPRAEAG